ncbi:hypothetical protein QAD02_010110 [Eretmocerus hayati]|uniref:Uncharacterized protein n=1 Tax=Eretmocerus hayati TaxID=131215 RepID=A0ACC2NB96_9HYME|nr:hypothetical protein QAD02_010110 [Eretmocerus hayati]
MGPRNQSHAEHLNIKLSLCGIFLWFIVLENFYSIAADDTGVKRTMAGVELPQEWEFTEIVLDQLQFMWGINRLGLLQTHRSSNDCQRSSEFSSMNSSHPRSNHKWMIKLCFPSKFTQPEVIKTPGEEQHVNDSQNVSTPEEELGYEKIIQIFLIDMSHQFRLIQANYTVELLSSNFSEISRHDDTTEYTNDEDGTSDPKQEYLLGEFPVNAAQLDHLMSRFIMKLNVSLALVSTTTFSSTECTSSNHPLVSRYTKNFFQKQYNMLKGDDQDVILVSSDSKIFNASSAVLSYYSPVFNESYKNHTPGENYLGFVEFDSDVINATLYFLSHGEFPESRNLTEKLYSFANKFDITDLKKRAEETICRSLSIEDADVRQLSKPKHFLEMIQPRPEKFSEMNTVMERLEHFRRSVYEWILSGETRI